MSAKEQAWTELRAEMILPVIQSWENAIPPHTEREWHESRDQSLLRERRGVKAGRNGGWRAGTVEKRKSA